jgi:hypothetical protein
MEKTLYEQVQEKVKSNPCLSHHIDFIMADWNEGNEHWDWVLQASNEEILDWIPASE